MAKFLDQEDLQLIEQFKAENLQKKNKIIEEYRYYDIPDGYKSEAAKDAPTYEHYLMNKIVFSPEDEKAVDKLGESAGTLERVRHLTSQVMTSEEWYRSVYGIGFFEKFNVNELRWYLYDAVILMSRWESTLHWENEVLIAWSNREKKGNWIWWLLGLTLFFAIGELLFGNDRAGYFQRSLTFFFLSAIIGIFAKRKHQKKQEDIAVIKQRLEEVKECKSWHYHKAQEHPLIMQQGQHSSSFFFETMLGYVNEGRVNTLQEALNLYHQESQYDQLLRQQAATLQRAEQIQQMATFNTIYNVLKK
ncbi:TPA: hypothetical protein TXV04_001295 [Streptococcus suis]|uniref:Uncharacterized protein n=3 Tax=Streptococcus suis TaxID=1307 RepID=A0A9X4RU38_STRSU|nr:hypothetical protein [Streptococcus suis]MBY4954800.1 hypothetical protein [Streptococcus suis]MBY4969793.1 hypothetical protein [Streptococcus suis]MBY4981908.1 hypothetical protein [Streptococcus suis]MBY4992654.1 hypothetical protein [Streptococcus suis]MBY5008061.1 hypothetical protein [Streptococcus suis]